MHILLTNDDGIRAPGICALYEALANTRGDFDGPIALPSANGDTTPATITVVAPETVQSATSHGVTFHEPLMARGVEVPLEGTPVMRGHAVDGRPADCVKLAFASLLPEHGIKSAAGLPRPDLVISGMNAGANCGVNIIYSGTVGAAIEAAFLGAPSIAVSLLLREGVPRFDVAARHARRAIERLIAKGLPEPHTCLNINIPATEGETDMPDIVACPMNTHGLVDAYERRVSPGGAVYYWAAGHGLDFHAADPGADVERLFAGNITVTPLTYDLTRRDQMAWVQNRLG